MLEFIVNLYKIILSYYFVAATYLLYKRKNNSVYPIYITYFLNALVLIILAATLDHRFIYPLVSIYFIIIEIGSAHVCTPVTWQSRMPSSVIIKNIINSHHNN